MTFPEIPWIRFRNNKAQGKKGYPSTEFRNRGLCAHSWQGVWPIWPDPRRRLPTTKKQAKKGQYKFTILETL